MMLRKFCFILFSITIAFSCSESANWSNVVHNEEESLSKEQIWRRDSIAPLNKQIITFDFDWATIEHWDKIGKGLATYYDDSGKLPKHSDIQVNEFKDSVVVSFWKHEILFCGIYGNAEVKDNIVTMYVGDICSPYDVPTDGEFALLHFKFVFKNDGKIAKKKFTVENMNEERLNYN